MPPRLTPPRLTLPTALSTRNKKLANNVTFVAFVLLIHCLIHINSLSAF